jgi:hypothetical protein
MGGIAAAVLAQPAQQRVADQGMQGSDPAGTARQVEADAPNAALLTVERPAEAVAELAAGVPRTRVLIGQSSGAPRLCRGLARGWRRHELTFCNKGLQNRGVLGKLGLSHPIQFPGSPDVLARPLGGPWRF